jgi:hypothetical protein
MWLNCSLLADLHFFLIPTIFPLPLLLLPSQYYVDLQWLFTPCLFVAPAGIYRACLSLFGCSHLGVPAFTGILRVFCFAWLQLLPSAFTAFSNAHINFVLPGGVHS